MALLVFTDFLCWAPIAFFSLTAAFGIQFVSLEEAKVFTVFILPLNSCCNPFLYAILTKQFKKDCVLICKAIEESRVTRGIGRCRHSSNFSNRQTPGNTNSLGDRNSSKDGSSCQCQSRLIDKPKRHSPRWLPAPFRTFLRRIRAVETDMDSSSSANEYAYQIAEIQQKQQRKHRRAESVSSDNFSSSRSDSVKAIGCGLPMRIVGRRRNSWTVTRKPSSDSNLSSSRNDSSTSAMTASTSAGTAAWRTSRSSVSSDGGSSNYKGSLRDKDRIVGGSGKVHSSLTTTALPDVHKRSSSIRDKSLRQLPTSPLAAGILRQQSVATPTGNLVQRTVISYGGHATSSTSNAAGSKPKPRLTRQVAIQDDVYIPTSTKSVSFDTTVLQETEEDCPVHCSSRKTPRLQGVWESSIEEDDENSPSHSNQSEKSDSHRYHVNQALAIYTNRDRNRLGLVGFIPRKLSTISSRSCSMNPENVTDDVYFPSGSTSYFNPVPTKVNHCERSTPDPSSYPVRSVKEVKGHGRREERLLSKSDNDLYCHVRDGKTAQKSGSVAYLPTFLLTTPPTLAPSSSCSSHVHSSLLMIDDEVFEDHSTSSIHPKSPNCPISATETQPLI